MTATTTNTFRVWLKHSPHPLARLAFQTAKAIRVFEIPAPKSLCSVLYALHKGVTAVLAGAARVLWWTPLLKGRAESCGRRLYLYGGLPLLTGPLELCLGDDCRISGHTTFSARSSIRHSPRLEVGNNVGIGWQTTIAVARTVKLGDNVRIAGRAFLAGYPGHPLNAADRAAGLPDTDDQIGDIILEDDVWLGTGVTIMPNVTIGQGTIVAAGSVVTRSLPGGVMAGGVPAKVLRTLPSERQA